MWIYCQVHGRKVLNMDESELIKKLVKILEEYLDADQLNRLKSDICKNKLRYVLLELDQHKVKEISDKDRDTIADMTYYFG